MSTTCRLSETEGVLLSNEILPATDDITSDDGINSLHPSVVTGTPTRVRERGREGERERDGSS